MTVITRMLNNDPTKRPTSNDILENKTLQIRGQDYQLRYSFALAKQKNDSCLKQIREMDQKSKEITKKMISLKIDPKEENNLDVQINEIKKRFEQIKLKKTINNKRPNSTTNQCFENNSNRKNAAFKFDDDMTPLRTLDNNLEFRDM